jgi:hypothetical protein
MASLLASGAGVTTVVELDGAGAGVTTTGAGEDGGAGLSQAVSAITTAAATKIDLFMIVSLLN